MAKKSVKKQLKNFKIPSSSTTKPQRVDANKVKPKEPIPASVNLRYFQRSKECFSKWSPNELKSFSGFVEKMQTKTESQVTSVTQTCHSHKGAVSKKLPTKVSKDVKMYSLDVGSKGRVHGFFNSGTFFLIWIDRQGKILGH